MWEKIGYTLAGFLHQSSEVSSIARGSVAIAPRPFEREAIPKKSFLKKCLVSLDEAEK